jgi:hypothetical protein
MLSPRLFHALFAVLSMLILSCSNGSSDATTPDATTPDAVRARIEGALSIDQPFERVSALAEILGETQNELLPEAARAVLGDMSREISAADRLLLIEAWSRIEPSAATRWARAKVPKGYQPAAAAVAVRNWARLDPMAAVEALPRPSIETRYAIVAGWFESNQPGLLEYVLGQEAGAERQLALSTYLRMKIRRDGPKSVGDWAVEIPGDARFRKALFRQLASELAIEDPEVAVAWCDQHCDGPDGDMTRHFVARRWGEVHNPTAAFDWAVAGVRDAYAAGEEPSDDVVDAVSVSYRMWAQQDRRAALEWVAGLPEEDRAGAWLKPVVGMYVAMQSWKNPEEALRWVPLIGSELQRQNAWLSIAKRWIKQDEPSALAWIETSPLSEEDRAKARADAKNPNAKFDFDRIPYSDVIEKDKGNEEG